MTITSKKRIKMKTNKSRLLLKVTRRKSSRLLRAALILAPLSKPQEKIHHLPWRKNIDKTHLKELQHSSERARANERVNKIRDQRMRVEDPLLNLSLKILRPWLSLTRQLPAGNLKSRKDHMLLFKIKTSRYQKVLSTLTTSQNYPWLKI